MLIAATIAIGAVSVFGLAVLDAGRCFLDRGRIDGAIAIAIAVAVANTFSC